ncbi:hypothetical protein DENIS_0214 [Desulfonema ishimotonii]|uniref:Uncharacterized protein n=1 Tax=Desulfonema ishimotonii TaxID=45657 RepID=A0A401FQK9_9BACT|nr:hypothetical protein DENIS_0214 [Desulfonema ishimotonii]
MNVRAAEADLTGENPAILRAHRSLPEKSGAESGFEIQALVWSPDPESRMAVINGNIVRTGGIVDDASVQYIGTDYIVFRKGSARWRTRFQLN